MNFYNRFKKFWYRETARLIVLHKKDTSLRPIVGVIRTCTQELASYLAYTLWLHCEEARPLVKNSSHFIDILQKMTLWREDLPVSFDISLFTNIAVLESMRTIERKCHPPQHIVNIITHITTTTHSSFMTTSYMNKLQKHQ